MKEYRGLIQKIGRQLDEARGQAVREVNKIMVNTYWLIGKEIVEYEQKGSKRAQYGTKLLENISRDLTKIYGKGFSVDNIENMRRFYLCFKNSETLSRKLSWSAYCLILRLDNHLAREFYIIEAENWSVRELERQINSMLFERISKDLKDKCGKGFSKSNVYLMRQFYQKYPKFQTVSGKLSYSHYAELLSLAAHLKIYYP
ncbi:MAG: DUF1016 N-terminal domain-containing protein [Candidatus Woesearchaeota archaeon]